MKIREALKEATAKLETTGIASAAIDAKVLLGHTLGLNTGDLFLRYEEEIPEDKYRAYNLLIAQRLTNRPVAYITGHKEFYSLDFIVNEKVLVPRPETEILVEEALKFLEGKELPQLLDICTGSGNIPISICHEARERGQEIAAFAFDISPDALGVAERNREMHGIRNLVLFQLDLFAGIKKSLPPLCPSSKGELVFDVITANPPYVPMEDKPGIAPDVIDFEPHIALFEEDRGCRAIFTIVQEAEKLLKKGGLLLVEISSDKQAEYIGEWFKNMGLDQFYARPTFIKDYAGIDRFLRLIRN